MLLLLVFHHMNVPERYGKCLRVSSSVKGKSRSTSPSGRDRVTSQTANVGGDLMNPGIRILPLSSTKDLIGADERVEVRVTSCLQNEKVSLKADEPQVGQWHEDVGRKLEFYYITIFPEMTWSFKSRKKRTSECNSNRALQEFYIPQVLSTKMQYFKI